MIETLISVHVVGIILWMGGLFMLARHVGMHASLEKAPQEDLKVYESKSYYMLTLPGLVLTLGTGLYLLFMGRGMGISYYLDPDQGWGGTFHAKLMLVVVLLIADQFFHMRMRQFHQKGEGKRGVFMAVHGIVGLCFIIIVFLVKGRYLA